MPVQSPGFSGRRSHQPRSATGAAALCSSASSPGKPVVLVLMNGSALSVNWADEHVPAIIEAWYPGGQGGDAIARLIAGDYSPAGRLPLTFYRSAGQSLAVFGDVPTANRIHLILTGEAPIRSDTQPLFTRSSATRTACRAGGCAPTAA